MTHTDGSFVASFSAQRQRLLHHAGSMLSPETANTANPKLLAGLSGMLASALEMLKVAEEQLLENERASSATIEAKDQLIAQRDALFERAPVALLLTTTDTTIRECNRAAAGLLGLSADQARGKQLVAMAPRQQSPFKEQVAHAIAMGAVAAWSFTLAPVRDIPIVVTAGIEVIDDEPALGGKVLFWTLRPTL
jgi:PAS domain-containing protein